MAEKRVTLFELHIAGDVQIGPAKLPGNNADEPPDPEPPTKTSPVGKLLVAVLMLGLVAAVVWRLLTGNERHTAPTDHE